MLPPAYAEAVKPLRSLKMVDLDHAARWPAPLLPNTSTVGNMG